MKRWFAAAALCAAATAAVAQQPPAPSPEAGKRAYTSYCARCHGIELRVGSSAFFDLRTFPKDDKARFIESVTNGKRAMPAWKDIVTPEQMDAIWAYIGQVNGW